MSRSSHGNTLPTVIAKTIMKVINDDNRTVNSAAAIAEISNNIIESLVNQFPDVFTADIMKNVFAFTLCNVARKGVKQGTITVADYMSVFATHKAKISVELNDFGAFGDLVELLVRLYFVKVNLHNWTMLAVKSTAQVDLISKKLGKTEIGTNGKTWTQATLFDYMEGDFTAVIYGMFTDKMKADIFNLCACGEYVKGADYVANYMCVWADKYQYQKDLDNLSRGKGITLKGENVQTVCNAGKFDQFQDAIENGMFTTLKDYLKK